MSETSFKLTDSAAARIQELGAQDGREGVFLRLRVDGGGCSGFQYVFGLETEKAEDDVVFTHHDATVVIDTVSLPFLEGAVLNYVDDFGGAMLKVENPNASSSCGCGTSFSV